jgi:hypothetical protein
MPDPSDLQFERATYESAPSGVTCAMCGKAVTREYWQWVGRVTCGTCLDRVRALEANAGSAQTFARAALMGTATAFGCGVGYAVLVGTAQLRLALVTIGIAYLVGTVIRKATGNISGRQYQVLAVALTYVAGAMGNIPLLWRGIPDHVSPGNVLTLLSVPIVEAGHDPINVLIIGLGLVEAWRRTRPVPMTVTGPYRVPTTPSASP